MESVQMDWLLWLRILNYLTKKWLIDYNTIIPHHSLQMNSPVQYLLKNHNECHMFWTNTLSRRLS